MLYSLNHHVGWKLGWGDIGFFDFENVLHAVHPPSHWADLRGRDDDGCPMVSVADHRGALQGFRLPAMGPDSAASRRARAGQDGGQEANRQRLAVLQQRHRQQRQREQRQRKRSGD